MARRTLLPLVALLVFAVGLVVFLTRGLGDGASAASDARPAPRAVAPGVPLATTAETPLSAPAEPAPGGARPESNERVVARPVTSGVAEAELLDAHWVEGRLEFPEGTPLDERVVVVAQGREFEATKKLHKSAVERDGRFRVAFSKATKKAWLRLEARYLYLGENPSFAPASPPADIVLKPLLGGGFRGRLVPSAGAQPFRSELVGATVSASGWQSGGGMPRQITARADENLEFVLGGFAPDMNWSLEVKPKGFSNVWRDGLAVQKGVLQTLDVEIQRGARVKGRVIDEAGEPVAKAAVSIPWGPNGYTGELPNAKTKPDGTFELVGIRAGKTRVVADKDGFRQTKLDETEFQDGEERASVDIVLTRGNEVAGLVRWPDGTPAADVRISVEDPPDPGSDGNEWYTDNSASAKSGADGTFRVTGLRAGPFKVTARSSPKEIAAVDAAAKPGAKRGARARFSAEVENVAPNASGFVITLQAGLGISGRVVDDLGKPVTPVLVRATPAEDRYGWNGSAISKASADADGRFEIYGLKDGEWEIVAAQKNGLTSAPVRVQIPGQESTIEIMLPRPAVLVGVVVDPTGAPIENARVEIESGDDDFRGMVRPDSVKRRSGPQGRFQIEKVRSGPLKVHAEHPDFAPSAPVAVEVAPAVESAPLTLQLRRGGVLLGRVLDAAGKPAGGRRVNLWGQDRDWRNATSTTDGTFRLERLAPGELQLQLEPSAAERVKLRDENGSEDESLSTEFNRQRTVTIVDGEVVEVVLGGTPRAPVRLHGLVTAAGKALAGASVQAWAQHGGDQESRRAKTDASGRYEIVLSAPGEYSINVQAQGGSSAGVQRTIPEVASYELDFALPGGRITGRVVSADGAPLAGVSVQLNVESHAEHEAGAPEEVSASWGHTNTGAEGAFAFDLLAPGTYMLTATMEDDWREGGRAKAHGRVKVGGLVLTAQKSLDGVELRMPRAGLLAGIVLGPDGKPVPGAQVDVRAATGEQLNSWMERNADAAGRFRVSGLPAGVVTVRARKGTLTTRDPASVTIQSGATSEVSVHLEPGTTLRVFVEDSNGQAHFRAFEVVDSKGHTCHDASFGFEGEASPETGWPVGPLAAGTYTVVIPLGDEKSSRTEVRVGGSDEQTVRIRIRE